MIHPIQQLSFDYNLSGASELFVPEVKVSFFPGSMNLEHLIVRSSEDVVPFLHSIYKKGEIGLQEHFNVLFLNRRNEVIGYYKHTIGGHSATIVDSRIVVSAAIKSIASGVILSHNHPSGSVKPSMEDIRITNRLKTQLELFEITVLDHIILTEDAYFSFADESQLSGLKGFAIDREEPFYGIPELSLKEEKELGVEGDFLGRAEGRNKIYQMVNERILSLIRDNDDLFWRKTWIDEDVDTGEQIQEMSFGRSFHTGKLYSGINFWAVNIDLVKDANGETSYVLRKTAQPFWLTHKQIKDKGGQLNRKAKPQIVLYYLRHFSLFGKGISPELYWKIMDECSRNPDDKRCGGLHSYAALKYYRVYNQKDVSGIDFKKAAPKVKRLKPLHKDEKVKACELMIKHMPNAPKIEHGGSRAYYNGSQDMIGMPKAGQFENINEYYGTLFHELVHATGHSSRIGRKLKNAKQSKDYAFEELVAELGACYLNAESGILFRTLKNSAAYLKGWNKKLMKEMEEDNSFFFKASSEAQKASNYILNLNEQGEPAFYRELFSQSGEAKKTESIKVKTLRLRAQALAIRLRLQTA